MFNATGLVIGAVPSDHGGSAALAGSRSPGIADALTSGSWRLASGVL